MTEWILSSVVLIVAVCIIRIILKGKIGLRLQYALWGIVLLRLLIPVNLFQSSISITNLTNQSEVVKDVEEITFTVPTREHNNLPSQTPVTNEPQLNQEVTQNVITQNAIQDAPQATTPAVSEKETTQPVQQQFSLTEIAFVVWVIGMAIVAFFLLFANICFFLRLVRSRKKLEVTTSPLRIYVTNAVETPCLFGLFRPAVYLTPAVAANEATMQHVLAHELTHFRHLDFIWTTLRSVCLVLHWYNPLVWIAAKLSRQDAELACDEGALKRIGEEKRADYGRTLIDLTCRERFGNILISATTMTGGKKAIKERITLLMKKPKTAIYTAVALLIVGTMLVGCTFSGSNRSNNEETESEIIPTDQTAQFENEENIVDKTAQSENEFLSMIDDSRYETEQQTSRIIYNDLSYISCLSKDNKFQYQVWYKDELILGPSNLTNENEDFLDIDNTEYFMMTYKDFPTFIIISESTSGEEVSHYDIRIFDTNGKVFLNENFRGINATFDLEHKEISFYKSVPNPNEDKNNPLDNEMWEHHFYSFMYPMAEYITPVPLDGLIGMEMNTYNEILDLFYTSDENTSHGYNQGLTCYYSSPEELDLWSYFYNGVFYDGTYHNDITQEELHYIETENLNPIGLDLIRVTEDEMNDALLKYFGISLEQTNKNGLDALIYYEPMRSYLKETSDTNARTAKFACVRKLENGNIELFHAHGIITLRNQDGSWKIVSHLPLEGQ